MKNNTNPAQLPTLLQAVFTIVQAHRPAFRQERTYQRMLGLLLGELFSFARHTLTQGLLALGLTDGDWSAWDRLFSRPRFDEPRLAECLLRETLPQAPIDQPYTVAMDGTLLHRSSLKMPGTAWLKDSRFAAFLPGLHRAQRFLHGAWLTPIVDGFSRAIPLRFLPAFPPKAVPAAQTPARREWEAGRVFLGWVRGCLDQAGRKAQPVLALADGGFDVLELWRGLPERVILVTRTARNRALYYLAQPEPEPGVGRPPSYGERAPRPADWLHRGVKHWPQQAVRVRGKEILMRYQVVGAVVREGLPERPLFLIVVKGVCRRVGTRRPHYLKRPPAFFLVSAIQTDQDWELPLPIADLLAWLWQRWEIEVAHRELKSGWGWGEMQCWNPRSAVVSVQWSGWGYGVLLLAGYRCWGLTGGPPTPARWWKGAKRWSLTTLWRALRAEVWGQREFRALWTGTGANWWKMEAWIAGWHNATAAASRI